MMATLAATLPVSERWSYEVKWDGYLALLVHEGRRAKLLSRHVKDLSRDFPQVTSAAARIAGVVEPGRRDRRDR